MDKSEIAKLQAHLRRCFGAPGIKVQPSSQSAETADVWFGERRIGSIVVDDEDGDRSFSFEMKAPVERHVLQDYLRRLFGNDALTVAARLKKTEFGRTQQRPGFPRRDFGRRPEGQELHAADGHSRFRPRGFVSRRAGHRLAVSMRPRAPAFSFSHSDSSAAEKRIWTSRSPTRKS